MDKGKQSILGTLELAWILAGVWGQSLRGCVVEQLGQGGQVWGRDGGRAFPSERSPSEGSEIRNGRVRLQKDGQGRGALYVPVWGGV